MRIYIRVGLVRVGVVKEKRRMFETSLLARQNGIPPQKTRFCLLVARDMEMK